MTDVKAYIRLVGLKLRRLWRKVLYWRPLRSSLYFLHHFSLPGNRHVPLYDVLRFFLRSIFNGDLNQRAKGLSFSFMTALPPLLIFFFTLVAFLPFDGVQDELLAELGTIIPEKVMDPVSQTVNDVMGHRHTTLLSIGFATSIILAANGLMGVISSLNFANRSVEKRPYVQRYLLCIMLVFVIYVVIVLTMVLLMGHKLLLQYIYLQGWLSYSKLNTLLFNVGRWVLIVLALLTAVSLIYYWAPAKKQRVGFFSAGSVLATAMFLVLSWALGLYFNNFNRYNLVYGSIGTLLLLMFWIRFNCIVLLVGYELNISIYSGTIVKKNRDSRREFVQRIQNRNNDNTKRTRESGDGEAVTA